MYYYAFLDGNDICTAIYAMPAPITGTQFIPISTNDQSLVGQRYNRSTSEFVTVYYYAVLDNRGVVSNVTFSTIQQETSASMLAITFAQYQTVTGLYWNGTEFVTPPISVIAVASSNDINYKNEEMWLSDKLDNMDSAISGNAGDISTLSTNISTITQALQGVIDSLAGLNTAVNGKANAVHSHTAADLTGVVKSINGTAPDENGNVAISVSGGGMTASEILNAIKGVDGSGSGLDADTLDGNDASYFASVTALNGKADASHTHEEYATTEALASKADSTHNHDSDYAPLSHTHEGYATVDHTHTGYATTAALDEKSDIDHTHSEYITAQAYANGMNGKADTNHTHSGYLPTSGGTVNGNLNVSGILRVNGQQSVYDSGTMITLSTNNRETMIAGSKIYSKVAISVSSDERLKEAIKEAPTEALAEMIDNLDVKTYRYIGSDEENVGIIAQELIEANPDLADYFVRTDKDGYYSVKAADLVFPLIVSVQKLRKEVDELKNK